MNESIKIGMPDTGADGTVGVHPLSLQRALAKITIRHGLLKGLGFSWKKKGLLDEGGEGRGCV